jgi:lysophospholipase L1-like esterase
MHFVSGMWRRVRGRVGGRGLVAGAGLLVAVLVLTLVVAPLTASGSGGRQACAGRGCPVDRPWLSLPAQPRFVTPTEAATGGGYVALGDSFSAGVGAYAVPADQAPSNACSRTSDSYPELLEKAFSFPGGLSFWACSGAQTDNILHGQFGVPPQIGRLSDRTSLVTLSVGGNDSGFADVIRGCVVKLPFSSGCTSQALGITKRLIGLRGTLTSLYQQIAARAPNARVLVMGYPQLFSSTTGGTFNLSMGDQRFLNAQGLALDQMIRQCVQAEDRAIVAARGKGSFEYVDASNAFRGHEVGTPQPYVNGLDVNLMAMSVGPQSFHPTAAGYQALAALFEQQIRNGPGRPILQYR